MESTKISKLTFRVCEFYVRVVSADAYAVLVALTGGDAVCDVIQVQINEMAGRDQHDKQNSAIAEAPGADMVRSILALTEVYTILAVDISLD